MKLPDVAEQRIPEDVSISDRLQKRFHPRMIVGLFLFWLILAGVGDWQTLFTGIVSSMVITLFWGDFLLRREEAFPLTLNRIPHIIRYLWEFLIELILANIQVARIVLNPRMPISPGFVRFRLELDKDISRVMLANSITLTPGTLTVYLEGKEIIVHALTEDAAHEVAGWKLEKRLKLLEEGDGD